MGIEAPARGEPGPLACVGSRACSWESTSAGRSPTPSSSTAATLHTAKAPTTPDDQSRGVLAAIDAALERAGAGPEAVEGFAHGMTVGTNALLDERGARTALVATRGFADLLEIARQDRPQLYHLCAPKPAPLVAERDRVEAAERVGPDGVIAALADERARARGRRGRASSAPSRSRSACSSPISSPPTSARSPSALRDALPGVHVSASHEVLPQFREYERCSTTVIDAYLSPLLGRYLGPPRRGGRRARAARAGGDDVLGRRRARPPRRRAPAPGACSRGPPAARSAPGCSRELSGDGNALGFDMGGTSCDVCVVEDGRVRRTDSREIGGRVIQLPMVDVHTVGAGGGSIGWRDAGGALRVGPRSAGAEPGPACYGRGGTEPTVTDANLLLGYLGADSSLAGGVELDADAAEAAVGRLADELGLDPLEPPRGSSGSRTRRWSGRCASSRSSAASTRAASR